MTRAETISPSALQARVLELAADRVIWMLGDQAEPGPDLGASLQALAPIGRLFLQDLIGRFGLTTLQSDLFLLAAGTELGPKAAAALAAHPLSVQGRACPALAALALGPEANAALGASQLLRESALIQFDPGSGFAQRHITLPDVVAGFLHGVPAFDETLRPALTPLAPQPPARSTLAAAFLDARGHVPPALLHLATSEASRAHAHAAQVAAELGLAAFALDTDGLPSGLSPAEAARRLNRDLVLMEAMVCLPATQAGCQMADAIYGPCVLWGDAPAGTQRPLASLAVGPSDDPSHPLEDVRRSFTLSPRDLRDVAATHALGFTPSPFAIARSKASRALETLAERIVPQATWDDLVLPDAQMAQLRQLAQFKAHRDQVLGDWGFRAKSSRGLALTALFSGPSGTGKTMAAEILARELGPEEDALDLFRIDLSAVVSKYIGETEKNLGRLFDAAEAAGAVLIFDEGEALFAKRSADVKDSLDRHSNAETAYLLQRLEAYTGIAIVTTNLKASVDDAFLRRFRAVIEFSFPSAELRADIWRAVFPKTTPVEGLDYQALSRLAVSGGFIRSIALTAAFLAAQAGTPVTMAHLERATRQEYGKLGKPLSEAELRGFR